MQSATLRISTCSTSYGPRRLYSGPASGRSRLVARVSPFTASDFFDNQFREIDRQFQQMEQLMERDIDAALSRARELERQANAQAQRALRESASASSSDYRSFYREAPNVDIQRQEERAPGMYRYYERIQITSGGGGSRVGMYTVPPPAATLVTAPPASGISAAFVGALVAVGGYMALTVAFNRNYQLTSYAESKRWLLMFLWPLLVLFSPRFREQFSAAVKGERVGLKREGADGKSEGAR